MTTKQGPDGSRQAVITSVTRDDLPDGGSRDRLRQLCWEEGLATLACGPHSVRFRPALVFDRQDVDRAIEVLDRVLARL